MKYPAAIVLWFSLAVSVFPQEMRVSVEGTKSFKTAALLQIQGEKTEFVDSIRSAPNGDYTYQFNSSRHMKGLYRLQFDHRRFLNIVYDNEPVNAVINIDKLPEGVTITESASNVYYHRFIRKNKEFKTKTDILNYVLVKYPEKDEYFLRTLAETDKLQQEYQQFIQEAETALPNALITRYIRSAQLPRTDYTLPIDQQLQFLKSHLLDNIDFQDYQLIYTDVYANKSIEYLMLYSNPQLPKELLEKEYMKAVDSILNRARKSEIVYKHIVEYLIDGFRKFGFDLIIDYIVTNYVIADDICLDAKLETSIERRINQSKFLKIGSKAPELILPDKSGKEIKLSSITAEKTLLVFYSTGCPHCKEVLPKLGEIYKGLKNTEVIAVSMDEKKEEWEK
ncbi:MAG: peroxiredoxin family protein, partial [Ignavibacteriaceae bacterium]|nr:peroxiredoxin family protein [Ignavibacteriaceae bacterium]